MTAKANSNLRVTIDDDGRLDEIVFADWLQIEHMGGGVYDVHVGDWHFGVSRRRNGRPHVVCVEAPVADLKPLKTRAKRPK